MYIIWLQNEIDQNDTQESICRLLVSRHHHLSLTPIRSSIQKFTKNLYTGNQANSKQGITNSPSRDPFPNKSGQTQLCVRFKE